MTTLPILSALARGALTPADVAGLPGAVAVLGALLTAQDGRRGLAMGAAQAALVEAGYTSEATALPEAMRSGGKRGAAVRAIEDARARLAREGAEDEQGEGVADVAAEPAGGGTGRDAPRDVERPVVVEIEGPLGGAAKGRRGSGTGLSGSSRPPERARASEAALTWGPGAEGLGDILARLRGLWARDDALPRGACRCGRCVRCRRLAPVGSPAGAWRRTWRG